MTAANQALNHVYAQDALRMQYLPDSNRLSGRWRDRYDELVRKYGVVEHIFDTLIREMLGQTSEQQLKDRQEELAAKWNVAKYTSKLVESGYSVRIERI
jgi:hypothetical protein